jgi:AraC-like DNA-binding protein
MPNAVSAAFLDFIDAKLESFSICEVQDGCALRLTPHHGLVVLFVLEGQGSIECTRGVFPLRVGAAALVPAGTLKLVNGNGPVEIVYDEESSCTFLHGVFRFHACRTNSSDRLILGYASLAADVGDGLGFLYHLEQPLIEYEREKLFCDMFQGVYRELSLPGVGTKRLAETMMTQIVVLILRSHFGRAGEASPLYLPLMHPQLGSAVVAMISRPADPHCLESLARLAEMSGSNFGRLFAQTYGTSPMNYLQSLRMEAAARILRTSDTTIRSVAAAVGLASRSYFSRAFTAKYGSNPSKFRKEFRQCTSTLAGTENASGALTSERPAVPAANAVP